MLHAQPALETGAHDAFVRSSFLPDKQALREIGRLTDVAAAAEARLGRVDHVTRLPNRIAFLDNFGRLAAETPDAALILVTLADARHYNELLRALGHAYAEDFVRAGAARLSELLGPGVEIYHCSVLSLAFFLPDPAGNPSPRIVGDIVKAFVEPILCQDIPVNAKIGVGIRRLAEANSSPSETLRSALAAAQDSRRSFQGWARYDKNNDEAHLRAFRMLTDMPAAFRDDSQLSLHYQPRVVMRDKACVSAEALMRWTHPTMGAVSPGEFIPLAENTALITPLTQWVIDNALTAVGEWQSLQPGLRISINISPKNLEEPDFVDLLRFSTERHNVDPALVELEFTEGALAASTGLVLSQLAQIRAGGFEIAIDDFGSGYSNMSYLGKIPAKSLKIDQSFIRQLDSDMRSQMLVRSIIDLSHGLGYEVVAEGIETAASFDLLAAWTCDEGQGYFMSRPLAADRFREWIAASPLLH